jgi:hypothetical protein
LLEKIHDESPAVAALTLSVSDQFEQHFEELERAFFAAGDLEPAQPAPPEGEAIDVFDDVPAAVRISWRQRLIPVYRLGRLWLSMRVRLLLTVLRGAVPSAFFERLSPRLLALPLLVRSTEVTPRLHIRRPVLTVAAAVVLVSTLASVWAGVVLAATRLGS